MSRTVVMNNKFIPSDFLPIGFLGYLPYAAVPAGWLVCDGTVYSIADYPELAAKIGNTYGGDGVTTFAVPDDRGLFRRGLDLSKGYDVGRVLGSEQDQDVQPHTHPEQVGSTTTGTNASWSYANNTNNSIAIGQNTGVNSGTETRPKNRAYVPIIKAKNIYYDLSVQGGNAASLGGNPASYYAAASQVAKFTDFTGTFAANGYRKLPDGTIIQWGSGSIPSGTSGTVTFPIAFPTACYIAIPAFNSSSAAQAITVGTPTTTQVTMYYGSGVGGAMPFYWMAIGK